MRFGWHGATANFKGREAVTEPLHRNSISLCKLPAKVIPRLSMGVTEAEFVVDEMTFAIDAKMKLNMGHAPIYFAADGLVTQEP